MTMLIDLLGIATLIIATIACGVFAACYAECRAVETRRPLLHTCSSLVALLAAAVIAVPANWLMVAYFGGAWSAVGWVLMGIVAAAANSEFFGASYAEGRELRLEYGDEWVDHIGEEVL